MRNKAALSGNLRVVLWAALVVITGALLAGLCGIGLAGPCPPAARPTRCRCILL